MNREPASGHALLPDDLACVFPDSIVKGSSVRSPLENYMGSSTQSQHTEHSTQSEVHQCEVHLENYIGSSTRSQHTEHSTQSEVHQSEVHLENYIGSSTQSQHTQHSTQSEVHQTEVHRVKCIVHTSEEHTSRYIYLSF